ncbi:MAG: hypothetical protein WBP64_14390 [Nitrososphaeraceae archaeon]
MKSKQNYVLVAIAMIALGAATILLTMPAVAFADGGCSGNPHDDGSGNPHDFRSGSNGNPHNGFNCPGQGTDQNDNNPDN